MQCGRLIKLIKSWYLQVQNEALAPARMVSLMEKHVDECAVCKGDPDLRHELDRVILIVCPPTKTPKLLKAEEGGGDKEDVEFRVPTSSHHHDDDEEYEEEGEREEELDDEIDDELDDDDDDF